MLRLGYNIIEDKLLNFKIVYTFSILAKNKDFVIEVV